MYINETFNSLDLSLKFFLLKHGRIIEKGQQFYTLLENIVESAIVGKIK